MTTYKHAATTAEPFTKHRTDEGDNYYEPNDPEYPSVPGNWKLVSSIVIGSDVIWYWESPDDS